MATDYSTDKREKKEYLYYTCDWEARDWLNNIIRSQTHTEGRHTQQTKRITTTFNPETGEEILQYIKGQPQEVYTIPWDRKKAEEILFGAKTFGQDSLNITNTDEVQYTVKFPNGNPPRTAFSLEDFLNLSYKELSEKSKTVKSPYIADLERRVNPYK